MLMREYETLYIVRPDLTDEGVAQINTRMTGVIDREGGKLLRLDVWGKKKLAFEVKKNPKGVYVHVAYLGQSNIVSEFERNLRVIEPVIRYQTIRVAENVDVEKRLVEAENEAHVRAAEEEKRRALRAAAEAEEGARAASKDEWKGPGAESEDREDGIRLSTRKHDSVGEEGDDWEDDQ